MTEFFRNCFQLRCYHHTHTHLHVQTRSRKYALAHTNTCTNTHSSSHTQRHMHTHCLNKCQRTQCFPSQFFPSCNSCVGGCFSVHSQTFTSNRDICTLYTLHLSFDLQGCLATSDTAAVTAFIVVFSTVHGRYPNSAILYTRPITNKQHAKNNLLLPKPRLCTLRGHGEVISPVVLSCLSFVINNRSEPLAFKKRIIL